MGAKKSMRKLLGTQASNPRLRIYRRNTHPGNRAISDDTILIRISIISLHMRCYLPKAL